MSTLAQRRRARKAYQKAARTKPPGEGSRFRTLARVAALGGARSPGAVAAVIGRRKYGKARFQKMAAAGRKK